MKKKPDLANLSRYFLDYCRSSNFTPKTIAWHESSLKKLSRYCAAHGITDIDELGKEELREYVTFLQNSAGRGGRPMSPHSVATYIRSIRAFFAWLTDEEYIDANPAAKVPEPKAGAREVPRFTPEEVRRIVNVCSGKLGARDEAIVRLLYDSGLRATELVTARLDDISEQPPGIQIVGKGRKVRHVPIGAKTIKAMRRYLRNRKDDSGYVFVTSAGEPLTGNGLYQLIARLGERAGLEANPHKFRHSFAINYLRNGGDLATLQKILGHATLDMSLHYADLAAVDVAQAHRIHSPGDDI